MFIYIIGGILFIAAIVLAISSWSWPFKQDYEFSKSHDYDIDKFVEDDEYDEQDEDYGEGFDSDEEDEEDDCYDGHRELEEHYNNVKEDERDISDQDWDNYDKDGCKIPDKDICDHCLCHTPQTFDQCLARSPLSENKVVYKCSRPVRHSGNHSYCSPSIAPHESSHHPWHTWPNESRFKKHEVKDNECPNCLYHTSQVFDTCKDKSPTAHGQYICNRPIGHKGDHTYCCITVDSHPWRTWPNESILKKNECPNCLYHISKKFDRCLTAHKNGYYLCNRPKGHSGVHSICITRKTRLTDHPYHTWPQENKTLKTDQITTKVCGYCLYHQTQQFKKCLAKSPTGLLECNRPAGHIGCHSFCGQTLHPHITWPNKNKLTDGDRDMRDYLLKK